MPAGDQAGLRARCVGVAVKARSSAGAHSTHAAARPPSCLIPVLIWQGKAHLKLDVFCPPYEAPEHGSVWYKGREYLEATSTAPESRSMIHLPVGGDCPSGSRGCAEEVPAAVVGVDIPEGDQVQVSCKEHYRLTEAGTEVVQPDARPRCSRDLVEL
jgi:hypothetical protein